MNRNELIADITSRTGFKKKDVAEIVDAYEKSILAAISSGDSVLLHKFMRIERKMQKARSGYDFENKRPIILKESECIKIRPGVLFTECLNQGGD